MSVAIVTGSAGLIGSEVSRFFAAQGLDVVGIDNDMRRTFFGDEVSMAWMRAKLVREISRYRHVDIDVRDESAIRAIFCEYGRNVSVVIHAAAQPSHDWAARAPDVDFTVNAVGTLVLLEATRRYCPMPTASTRA
jgi:CDP-paratose 2-epimerase